MQKRYRDQAGLKKFSGEHRRMPSRGRIRRTPVDADMQIEGYIDDRGREIIFDANFDVSTGENVLKEEHIPLEAWDLGDCFTRFFERYCLLIRAEPTREEPWEEELKEILIELIQPMQEGFNTNPDFCILRPEQKILRIIRELRAPFCYEPEVERALHMFTQFAILGE